VTANEHCTSTFIMSSKSEVIALYTGSSTPAMPSNLRVISCTANSIQLSWVPPDDSSVEVLGVYNRYFRADKLMMMPLVCFTGLNCHMSELITGSYEQIAVHLLYFHFQSVGMKVMYQRRLMIMSALLPTILRFLTFLL